MNAKHTPGPWQVRCHDMVYDADNRMVADCENLEKSKRPAPPTEQDMANARLIASAPDLLSAIESVLSGVDRNGGSIRTITPEAIIQCRAAIAKARGA